MVENKIRHAMATGQLPSVERNSTTGQLTRPESDKSGSLGTDHTK